MGKKKIFISLGVILIVLFLMPNLLFAEDLVVTVNTILTSGSYTYDNVTITNGATLLFDGAVMLTATNLTIDPTSSISSDGKGYAAGIGPGAGLSPTSGGSYGGEGGKGSAASSASTYGSAIAPIDLGSGSGRSQYVVGNPGGGAIRL